MTDLEKLVTKIKEQCSGTDCCRTCEYFDGLCKATRIIDAIAGKYPEEWRISTDV